MMSYQFDLSNLEIINKLPLNEKESNQLIKQLFETWAGYSQKKGRRLKATLCQRTEGRSSVQVFELIFNYADNSKRAATFILRFHKNENDANKEQEHARQIKATASQYFAEFVDKQFNNPGLVVYRHVADQTGANVYDLKEYLCDLISKENETEVNFFTDNLKEFSHQIVKVYNSLKELGVFDSCSSYYEKIAHQLPPDLIINGYVDSSRDKTIVIKYGRFFPVPQYQQSISATQLVNQLDNIKKQDEEWIRVKDICLTSNNCLVGRDNIVYFLFSSAGVDDVQIWLGTHKEQCNTLNFEKEKRYELVFHKNAVELFTTKLESIGFNTNSCILHTYFNALCKEQRVYFFSKMRHNDFHCGNVLVSGPSLKIIDVGDMKPDLLASDIARLEVSIWFDVAGRIGLSEAEAKAIIKGVPNGNLSFKAWVLKQVLQSLRDGFENGIEHKLSQAENVLAYVTQIWFYQRYCLLESGVDKISPAFNVFACHWISQFRGSNQNDSFDIYPDNEPIPKMNDIFVSYARVDNEPLPGADKGWVTTLINGLTTSLAQNLGRADAYSLWMDFELRENEPIPPEIAKQLENSATLLLILSPGYLASSWCRWELDTFLTKVGKDSGRVFVVERHKMELPEELTDLLGYKFWVTDNTGKPRTLAIPKPKYEEFEYYQKLDDLARELSDKLKSLKEPPERESAVSTQEIAPIPTDSHTTIFLAVVSDDLEERRDEVKRYLEQQSVRVLPEKAYSFANIQPVIDQDLNQCSLFVQLLSEKTGNSLPKFQYERAIAVDLPILQWRAKGLNLNEVHDQEHKVLLSQSTVMASSLVEFQEHVINQLNPKPKPAITIDKTEGSHLVFINAAPNDDMPLANQIKDILMENGIGCVLPPPVYPKIRR